MKRNINIKVLLEIQEMLPTNYCKIFSFNYGILCKLMNEYINCN